MEQLRSEPQMKKFWVILFSFATLSVLGFAREYLFESLNKYLSQVYYNYETPYLPEFLSFFKNFSYNQLYYGKFVLTLITALIFYVISMFSLSIIFKRPKLKQEVGIFYSSIFILSFLIFILGHFFTDSTNYYGVSRRIADVIQSPLAYMLLLVAYLIPKAKPTKTKAK